MYCVIPRSSTIARISENKDFYNFELDQKAMEYIGSLNKDQRCCDPVNFWNIPLFD